MNIKPKDSKTVNLTIIIIIVLLWLVIIYEMEKKDGFSRWYCLLIAVIVVVVFASSRNWPSVDNRFNAGWLFEWPIKNNKNKIKKINWNLTLYKMNKEPTANIKKQRQY